MFYVYVTGYKPLLGAITVNSSIFTVAVVRYKTVN